MLLADSLSWKLASVLAIAAAVIILVGYDLLVWQFDPGNNTLSQVSLHTSQAFPGFSFIAAALTGILLGHLFCPGEEDMWVIDFGLVVTVAGVLVVLADLFVGGVLGHGFSVLPRVGRLVLAYPQVAVCVGFCIGVWFGHRFLAQSPTV